MGEVSWSTRIVRRGILEKVTVVYFHRDPKKSYAAVHERLMDEIGRDTEFHSCMKSVLVFAILIMSAIRLSSFAVLLSAFHIFLITLSQCFEMCCYRMYFSLPIGRCHVLL